MRYLIRILSRNECPEYVSKNPYLRLMIRSDFGRIRGHGPFSVTPPRLNMKSFLSKSWWHTALRPRCDRGRASTAMISQISWEIFLHLRSVTLCYRIASKAIEYVLLFTCLQQLFIINLQALVWKRCWVRRYIDISTLSSIELAKS